MKTQIKIKGKKYNINSKSSIQKYWHFSYISLGVNKQMYDEQMYDERHRHKIEWTYIHLVCFTIKITRYWILVE